MSGSASYLDTLEESYRRTLAKIDALTRVVLRDTMVMAYGQNFTLWHTKARDIEIITCPDFWREMAGMSKPGDRVMVSARNGAADLVITDRDGTFVVMNKVTFA